MSNSATELAQQLISLPKDEADAALRQYELRKVAKREEEEGPLSTGFGVYRQLDIPVPPILVKPALVVRGGVTITIGRAGRGKTMMNLNRLMRWAAGSPMFKKLDTLAPTQPCKILIVENEGAATMFQRKVRRMFDAGLFTKEEQDAIDENLYIFGDGGYSGVKMTEKEHVLEIKYEMERTGADILFIEPLRSLHSGEENSSTEVQNVMDALTAIAAEFQAGVVVSHHERKSGTAEDGEFMSLARGSTAIEGAVDVMENWRAVKNGAYRELSWSKNRYEPAAPVRMQWDHERHWYTLVPTSEIGEEILELLTESGATVKDIAAEIGETEAKVRRELAKLLEDEPPRVSRFNIPGGGYLYRAASRRPDNDEDLEY